MRNTISNLLRAVFSIALLLPTTVATAAIIDVDTVLGPGHPFPNETITVVDGANPPTNVEIIDGAVIGGQPGQFAVPTGLDVYGQSVVTMFGGIIVGTQQSVRINDDAVFHMVGGEIDTRHIESREASRIILDEGAWNDVFAYDSSRVHVNGGDENWVFSVRTFGQSHVVINSEKMHFRADEFSTIVINAGFFEGAEVLGNAEVLINGGSYITGLFVSENAVVRMRDIMSIDEEYVEVSDNASVHVYGLNLRFEKDDENRSIVRGNWADGDNFRFWYRLHDEGQIILHEVPEPTAWALLTIGAAGLAWRTRHLRGTAAN